jgi:metal-responsive CopG/Arc/MetJ family transcriptional regulator
MPSLIKQTAFRFSAEDLELLDAVTKHAGVNNRSDALRVILRYYARAEGLEVSQPKPKTRSKAKR